MTTPSTGRKISQIVTPTPVGPTDPNIPVVLWGSDDTTLPKPKDKPKDKPKAKAS